MAALPEQHFDVDVVVGGQVSAPLPAVSRLLQNDTGGCLLT